MNKTAVPEFAIVGHPNEGKSTVVSTLSEDDSVRISATPGETTKCRSFPVVIDGSEIIRFIDTPGFQAPRQTLSWLKRYHGPDRSIIQAFRQAHHEDRQFTDELELFAPIENGAGIIYVADGARPVRSNDRAEMEILRLTGRPRMAIVNCKDPEKRYLDDWKNEFAKHFNSIRVFNAHRATYAERIDLLDSLKAIHQDWQPALERVIAAFRADWNRRNQRSAELITEMLGRCLEHAPGKKLADDSRMAAETEKLQDRYKQGLAKIERTTHQKIRKLFKHNIFDLELPPQSIVQADLFDDRTWQILGLPPRQLAAATGIAGGMIGAAIDTAAAGLTFGVFTAIGGILGAGSALFGGRRMTRAKVIGIPLGGIRIQVGPNKNMQFLFILLDRSFIYYTQVINWAHGRRDRPQGNASLGGNGSVKEGLTSRWNRRQHNTCQQFWKNMQQAPKNRSAAVQKEMETLIKAQLDQISKNAV